MKRGHISGTSSPTVWVMSEVILEDKGRRFYVGPKREALRRQDWLWRVNEGFESVIIYVGRSASSLTSGYNHKTFSSFPEAVAEFRSDMRAGLFIVNDILLTAPPEIITYSRTAGIFNGY